MALVKFVWILVLFYHLLSLQGASPFLFVENMSSSFSEYLFGTTNCYLYHIQHDIVNGCAGNLRNETFCQIGTLQLCPSKSARYAKSAAVTKLQVPTGICYEATIKESACDTGVSIELYKSLQCRSEFQERNNNLAFVLCADMHIEDDHSIDNGVFCSNKDATCWDGIKVANICGEQDQPLSNDTIHRNVRGTRMPVHMSQNSDSDNTHSASKFSAKNIAIHSVTFQWVFGVSMAAAFCVLLNGMFVIVWKWVFGEKYDTRWFNTNFSRFSYQTADTTPSAPVPRLAMRRHRRSSTSDFLSDDAFAYSHDDYSTPTLLEFLDEDSMDEFNVCVAERTCN